MTRRQQSRIGGMLDRAIETVAPGWGIKRRHNRELLALSRAYDGARRDRPYDSWQADWQSPDTQLRHDLADMRDRCRDLARNNPIAASIVKVLVRGVVGCGLRPQSRINAKAAGLSEEQAGDLQRQAEDIFGRWTRFAATDERSDFYGLQRLAQRLKVRDGEAFAQIVKVRRPAREFETSVQLIAPERIESPGQQDTERRRMGVELGLGGQPVRYHVRRRHPGAEYPSTSPGDYLSIPAWDGRGGRRVLHLFTQNDPDQSRGVPRMAPSMTSLKDLGEVLEAERIGQRIEKCLGLIIKREFASGPGDGRFGSDGRALTRFYPGMVEELGIGEEVQFIDPRRPGSTFGPYIELMIRLIGAGVELPLELILMDWSSSNYSSSRGNLLEARRGFTCEQAEHVAQFDQPIYEAVLEEAWLRGEWGVGLDFYGLRNALTRADWLPDGWGWIDPVKEVQAIALAMENDLSNLAIESARQGRDWEETLRTKLLIEKRMKELRAELGLEEPKPIVAAPQDPEDVEQLVDDEDEDEEPDEDSDEDTEDTDE